jgi:hypothetical protein
VSFQPTLAVHVVWDSASATASEHARALFRLLFENTTDLTSHGIRIPLWTWQGTATELPPTPPLGTADRSVLIVLVDEHLAAADEWVGYVDGALATMRPEDIVLGVSMYAGAVEWPSELRHTNMIRLHEHPEELRATVLLNRVTHALCRMLDTSHEPVRMFLSHSKRDRGRAIAKRIQVFLADDTGVGSFYDAQDLSDGTTFSSELRQAAGENVLLAIRTDSFASRDWCRTEALIAKITRLPVVVVDALERFEPRGFPYLGNAPTVRWQADDTSAALQELLLVALTETLRFRYFPLRITNLCRYHNISEPPLALPVAPELLTAVSISDHSGAAVYPDPPLSTDELALVNAVAPNVQALTPMMLVAQL